MRSCGEILNRGLFVSRFDLSFWEFSFEGRAPRIRVTLVDIRFLYIDLATTGNFLFAPKETMSLV
jgi:hypothetical protein